MAGTTLGTAYVQIVPSAQGIQGSITNVLSGEATAAGAKSGGLFGKVFSGKVAKAAAIGGAALAAGLGVGIAALKKGIKETAAYGDNVDKMSQKLGLSAEAYQKWDYVLNLAGTDMQSMTTGLKTLTNQFQAAKDGNDASIKAFEQLGISMEDAANMSREDLFGAAIKGLQGMEDSTERAALANKLFGRSGQNLTPLFNQTAEQTQEQIELAEKYGMVMPEAAVKASAAFVDSVTTMKMTMTGLKNRIMAEFLPAATQITDGLGKIFAGDMSGVDDIAAGIKGIASKIIESAPVILNAAKRLGGQLIQGIMDNTGNIGEKAGIIIGKLVTGLITHLPQILEAGLKLIGGLAKGLIQAIPQIWAAVKQVGSKIITGLGSALWGKITAAANGIKERFLAPINNLRDKVKAIVEKIKGFFKFKISKPHVPLPHFSISPAGWKIGDLLKGKIPSLGIKWYAEGGVFDSPSLVGIGEAGPEAVVPLTSFWDRLDKMANDIKGGDEITINVYATPSQNVREIALEVERVLAIAQKQRNMAWQ